MPPRPRDERAAIAEGRAEPGAGHHQRPEGQRVHGDDQLELPAGRIEAELEARSRDRKDRRVHRRHRLTDQQYHQRLHRCGGSRRMLAASWTSMLD